VVSRSDETYVLYPAYFDVEEPRSLRRVPQQIAVPDPSADEVAKACAKLRLKPTLERSKHHPSRWHEAKGRVLVPLRGSKAVLVRQIAEKLHELRTGGEVG
jgi:signal recognition particle subunit SRP19